MKVVVSSLHLKDYTQPELYARVKVEKLAKYFPKILEIDVKLIANVAHRGQETDYTCEIIIKVPGRNLEIVDIERAMDKAIDKAVERAKRLLVKTKEKKISKWHRLGILNKLRSRFQ